MVAKEPWFGNPGGALRRTFGPPPGSEKEAEVVRGFAPWAPHEHLVGPQLLAFDDPERYGAWCTTRRAGKTTAALDWLVDGALATPGVDVAYIGLTSVDAVKTILRDLKRLCVKHGFADPFKGYNKTQKILTFENGSTLEIRGLNDDGEAEKYRGRRFARVVIDECQSQSSETLKKMVNDVISPTLADCKGQMRLIGTPGRIARKGVYWYDVTHGTGDGDSWSAHKWSILDNPFIPDAADELRLQAKRLGGEDSPAYRREYLGEWVATVDELVFPFKAERNEYAVLPEAPAKHWTYAIGLDLGHSPDRSALAVVGWRKHDPVLYLVYEHVFDERAPIDTLGAALIEASAKFPEIGMYVDEGALGAALADELRLRFPSLSLQAADKRGKIIQLEAMANDLLAGRIKFPVGSRSSYDTGIVQWDQKKADNGIREVAKKPHSDILDAVRYAIGGARHYWEEPAAPEPSAEERLIARVREQGQTPRRTQDYSRMGFR